MSIRLSFETLGIDHIMEQGECCRMAALCMVSDPRHWRICRPEDLDRTVRKREQDLLGDLVPDTEEGREVAHRSVRVKRMLRMGRLSGSEIVYGVCSGLEPPITRECMILDFASRTVESFRVYGGMGQERYDEVMRRCRQWDTNQ